MKEKETVSYMRDSVGFGVGGEPPVSIRGAHETPSSSLADHGQAAAGASRVDPPLRLPGPHASARRCVCRDLPGRRFRSPRAHRRPRAAALQQLAAPPPSPLTEASKSQKFCSNTAIFPAA